jgi:hypothetical protein
MKNRIDILDERLKNIMDIVGEVDFVDISNKYKQLSLKDKCKTITDVIIYFQNEIKEYSNTPALREILEKCNKLIIIY